MGKHRPMHRWIAAIALFSMAPAALAEQYIYFGRFTLRKTPAASPGNPLDTVFQNYSPPIAVSQAVYFKDSTGLRRAFADGTNPVTIVPSIPNYVSFTAIALDDAAGKIYFGRLPSNNDDDPYLVGMANLNGSGYVAIDSLGNVDYLAVDHGAGKVFWAQSSGSSGRIQSSNLNLTGVTTVSNNFSGEITGLGIDEVNHQIYYGMTTSIGRMNIDGTGQHTILNVPAYRMALNQADGKIYWVHNGQDIRRSNLDGSNIETVLAAASYGETFIETLATGDVLVAGPAATPAVSTWGAVALTFALLIVATNVLRTRRQSGP